MRSSVLLLIASLAGVLLGGWLTGRTGLGLCVIADSVAVGVWAVFFRDDGVPLPQPGDLPQPSAWAVSSEVASILDRSRGAR